MPPDFNTRRLPLFCAFEHKVEKATGHAVFLRLGSKEYVDYLEQKAGARRP